MALALGTRRSTVAAVASALAAMALAAAVAGRSCRVSTPGPDVAVRDMLQAAKTGDRDVVYELLGPMTRERLDIEAKLATEKVGSAVRYSAKDLINIGASDPSAAPTAITTIEEHGDYALVEVVAPSGERWRVDLARIDGAWRIELPQYGNGPAP